MLLQDQTHPESENIYRKKHVQSIRLSSLIYLY